MLKETKTIAMLLKCHEILVPWNSLPACFLFGLYFCDRVLKFWLRQFGIMAVNGYGSAMFLPLFLAPNLL